MKNPEKAFIEEKTKNKSSLFYLYRNIQKELGYVEDQLKTFTHSSNPLVKDINSYIFKKSGKRIRPALLLLCTKLFKYDGDEHILISSLVEALHTASLIHDDIIDNSELRRGEETVHVRWGANITVLMGDFLYVKALGLSLKSRYPRITEILNDTSFQMVDGELFEYHMSWNPRIREEDYLTIINKKTAALFSASCQIGGILGSASPEKEKILAEYGTCIGMCFQIVDDLLDYTGDEQAMGKPVLSDLDEGRLTLPLIYTLNNGSDSERERIIDFLKSRAARKTEKKHIIEMIRSNGALEYSRELAEQYARKSSSLIEIFPESPTREALQLFSEYILMRNK